MAINLRMHRFWLKQKLNQVCNFALADINELLQFNQSKYGTDVYFKTYHNS